MNFIPDEVLWENKIYLRWGNKSMIPDSFNDTFEADRSGEGMPMKYLWDAFIPIPAIQFNAAAALS